MVRPFRENVPIAGIGRQVQARGPASFLPWLTRPLMRLWHVSRLARGSQQNLIWRCPILHEGFDELSLPGRKSTFPKSREEVLAAHTAPPFARDSAALALVSIQSRNAAKRS